jgi:hypothetical protein
MTLRPRRNLVLWSQTARSPGRYLVLWSQTARSPGRYRRAPAIRGRRIRRWTRCGGLLILIGLMALGRFLLARWRLILAGAVLTVTGGILGGGPGSPFLLPGLMLLLSAPLLPGHSRARAKLERDLAAYPPAERRDLEATLDQYPGALTRELREILASQATDAPRNQIPSLGRR